MPIKDPTIYPPYWKQFSLYIRRGRAEGKCEQCGVANGLLKVKYERSFGGVRVRIVETLDDSSLSGSRIISCSKIVLTVAHLDHAGGVCDCKERTGRKCSRLDHVLALCQACHLAMDLPKHIENRKKTMTARNDSNRSLFTQLSAENK